MENSNEYSGIAPLIAPERWNNMTLQECETYYSPEYEAFDKAIAALEKTLKSKEQKWNYINHRVYRIENGNYMCDCVFARYV